MASGANKAETELMGSFIWDRLGGLEKKAPKKLLRESYQTPRNKEKEKKEKKPTKRPLTTSHAVTFPVAVRAGGEVGTRSTGTMGMGARSCSTTGCSYAGHEFTVHTRYHTNQQHRTEGAACFTSACFTRCNIRIYVRHFFLSGRILEAATQIKACLMCTLACWLHTS